MYTNNAIKWVQIHFQCYVLYKRHRKESTRAKLKVPSRHLPYVTEEKHWPTPFHILFPPLSRLRCRSVSIEQGDHWGSNPGPPEYEGKVLQLNCDRWVIVVHIFFVWKRVIKVPRSLNKVKLVLSPFIEISNCSFEIYHFISTFGIYGSLLHHKFI